MIFLFSSHPQGLRLIIPVSFGARELGSSGSPPHFGVPVLWDNLTHIVKLALNLAFCFYLLYVCEDQGHQDWQVPWASLWGSPCLSPSPRTPHRLAGPSSPSAGPTRGRTLTHLRGSLVGSTLCPQNQPAHSGSWNCLSLLPSLLHGCHVCVCEPSNPAYVDDVTSVNPSSLHLPSRSRSLRVLHRAC